MKWPYSVIKELKKEIEGLKLDIKNLKSDSEDYKSNQKILLLKIEDQGKEMLRKDNEIVALNEKMRKKEQDFKRTIEFKRLEGLGN